jgi:site-specific DNA-methyltransferase (adenine-specific)
VSDRLGPYLLGPNDTPENGIYTGDARELAKAIPDESVDLIFTDPPYHKHNAHLFGVLARIGGRVLRRGGLLLTLAGQAALPACIEYLLSHLDYYWLSSMPHSLGHVGRYHPKQIMCGGKPFLWFSRGAVASHNYVFDTFAPKLDKAHHEWGQPVGWFMYYINKLTDDCQVILDPFTGGAAVPVACIWSSRRYLAFEIEPDTAEIARERVRNTQPPLFVPEPQQCEMEFVNETT